MSGNANGTAVASDGPLVCEFLESFCRHTEGERMGQLIRLAPWQRDLLNELFRLRPDGLRQYQTALIGMPRKNGKSSLASGIALYLLLMDGEPGAQVYSCAGDRDQARIVFGAAKRMVELDPELSQRLRVYRDAIADPETGSVYRVLSADAPTKEGLNPSGVIFDELHVQPNRDLWDVMTLGSGTRRQPLIVAITTAGEDLEGTICGELYQYGRKVESGEIQDPTFFFRWWEAPRDRDWRDPETWRLANPALGEFLREDALRTALSQKPENVFRRYHLNQWVVGEESWLPAGAWEGCRAPELELDPALPLYVGIDIALRNDSTAVVCAQRQGERTLVRARVWENPYPEGDPRHGDWALNLFEVENHLRELRARFPVPACEIDGRPLPGPQFAYDPAFFLRSAQVLAGEGLAMVEFPQTDARMIPASQALYQLVVERKLAHDGDPALARQIGNAVADQKPRGWRLSKPRGSRRKIDAAIACAIAVWLAQQAPPRPRTSIYETRGLLTL